MRQQERQAASREKILQAGMEEFGTRNYDAVTMDQICGRHRISKGMMYHYCSGKEEVFLMCVEHVFRRLGDHLTRQMLRPEGKRPAGALGRYFAAREQFFTVYPLEKRVYENAMLYPPLELGERLAVLYRPIQELDRRFIRQLVAGVRLRPRLEEEQAVNYLAGMVDLLPTLAERCRPADRTMGLLERQTAFEDLLELMLYGVAQKE